VYVSGVERVPTRAT